MAAGTRSEILSNMLLTQLAGFIVPTIQESSIKKIAEYSAGFGIGGLPAAIRQLQAIARVTIKGLSPLIEMLKKS
jgi:hypothetical protein